MNFKNLRNMIRRNKTALIFIGALALLFTSIIYVEIADKYFFGILGALITLYIGITNNQLAHDNMVRELFQHYNEKYDDNLNDLLNEIRYKPRFELTAPDEKKIIDYLNLCSEEYFWYKKGRIPQEIWESWQRGINKNFKIPQVRKIVLDEKESSGDTYYNFFDDNRWELAENDDHDSSLQNDTGDFQLSSPGKRSKTKSSN